MSISEMILIFLLIVAGFFLFFGAMTEILIAGM